jgi:hypothetical protein
VPTTVVTNSNHAANNPIVVSSPPNNGPNKAYPNEPVNDAQLNSQFNNMSIGGGGSNPGGVAPAFAAGGGGVVGPKFNHPSQMHHPGLFDNSGPSGQPPNGMYNRRFNQSFNHSPRGNSYGNNNYGGNSYSMNNQQGGYSSDWGRPLAADAAIEK